MSLYELIGIGFATITAVWGYHKWLMSYISEKNITANSDLANTLKSIQTTQQLLWEKFDRVNEKVIVIDNTAVREEKVRRLMEEHRTEIKQDNTEIKTILNTLIASVEALKTEAAINKALNQRSGK